MLREVFQGDVLERLVILGFRLLKELRDTLIFQGFVHTCCLARAGSRQRAEEAELTLGLKICALVWDGDVERSSLGKGRG